MFQLPTSAAPIFGRATQWAFNKVQCSPVFDPNNPHQIWNFRIESMAGQWWNPAQTQLRMRLGFFSTTDDGRNLRPLTPADGVAPVMNLPPHLIQSMTYYMDGKKIEDMSDNIAQADTFKGRMQNSDTWLKTYGNSSQFWHPDFAARQALICPDYTSTALGRVVNGQLVSERFLVQNGKPLTSKGLVCPDVGTAAYMQFYGIAPPAGGAAPAFLGAAGAPGAANPNYDTENDVRPQWCVRKSGRYTYYCVATGVSVAAAERFLASASVAAGLNAGVALAGAAAAAINAALQARVADLLDAYAIQKREQFLAGHEIKARLAGGAAGTANFLEEKAAYDTVSTLTQLTAAGAAVASSGTFKQVRAHSASGGIPCMLDLEYKDGKIETLTGVWIPELELFATENKDYYEGLEAGSGGDHLFTSYDTIFYNYPVNDAVVGPGALAGVGPLGAGHGGVVGAGYVRPASKGRLLSDLQALDIDDVKERVDEGYGLGAPQTETSYGVAVQRIHNVLLRPLLPSEQSTPSSRHEMFWKPTLGVFDIDHNLPPTTHVLQIQIDPKFQEKCLEFGRSAVSGVDARAFLPATQFQALGTGNDAHRNKLVVRIEGLDLFVAQALGPTEEKGSPFILDLRCHQVTKYPLPTNQATAPTHYNFQVDPAVTQVSVAFQSNNAELGACSMSKFVIPSTFSSQGAETALTRFSVDFAGLIRPAEDMEAKMTYRTASAQHISPSPEALTTSTNYNMSRFNETMMNNGTLYNGCETFQQWLARGAYYSYLWPKDGRDRNTRFRVFAAFNEQLPTGTNIEKLLNRKWPRYLPEKTTLNQELRLPFVENSIAILVHTVVPKVWEISIVNQRVVLAQPKSVLIGDGVRSVRPRTMM